MNYIESIRFFNGLDMFRIKMGLNRMLHLCALSGHPEQTLKVIHVAGTNGKGSTSAMIASILKAAGYRVGLYTSPHLVRFNERIQYNGVEIADVDLARIVTQLCTVLAEAGEPHSLAAEKGQSPPRIVHDITPTYFEFATLVAFAYFYEMKVDFVVLEVGLGGRLDATNVVKPLVSVITTIAYDHVEFLGTTLPEIAWEKGGIIKSGANLVSGVYDETLVQMFQTLCRYHNVQAYFYNRDFHVLGESTQCFTYQGFKRCWENLSVSLKGRHQLKNAAVALAAIEEMIQKGFSISKEAIQKGLLEVSWPGRLMEIQTSPRIILDGAHNGEGILALADFLRNEIRFKHLHLVLSIMRNKDMKRMLQWIVPLCDQVLLTTPHVERAASPQTITESYAVSEQKWLYVQNPEDALLVAKSIAKPEDLICVTGSLYLIGEILAGMKT